MIVHGIAASECVDSSGEIISIEGCDITTLDKGGTLNWEHDNNQADSVVGRIVFAKKIFSEKDCSDDNQLRFYKAVNVPYIYIIGELFDKEGHPGSLAIAAMFNYAKKKNQPMMIGFSIEGSTMERDGMYLKRTVARRCAITVKPANKSCISDMLEQIPDAKKAMGSDDFAPLARGVSFEYQDYEKPDVSIEPAISDLLEFSSLVKTLTAGGLSGAPGTLVQGSALQGSSRKLDKEEKRSMLSMVKAYVRDNWKKDEPLDAFLKNQLPELGEKFQEHFDELVDDLHLSKAARTTATHRHVLAMIPHEKMQALIISGIAANRPDSSRVKSVNSFGHRIMVARGYNTPEDSTTSSEKSTIYHNLMRDFFHLGHLVPTTAVFANPVDGRIHHAQVHVDGKNGISANSELYDRRLKDLAREGLLHKIALADFVLGNGNRNLKNTLLGKDGSIHLVSNEKAFGSPNYPEFLNLVDTPNLMVDEDFMNWLASLSEEDLVKAAKFNGLSKKHANAAAERLMQAKIKLQGNKSIESLYE